MPYANVSRPNGFTPHSEAAGPATIRSRPVANTRQASAGGNASTDLALGDAYAIDANGFVYRAGPNDTVRGIVNGFDFAPNPAVYNANGPVSVQYISGVPVSGSWPNVLGIEDNKTVFEVQADTMQIPNNLSTFNLTDGAPDPLWRISQQKLNIGGGAGTQFKLVNLKNSPVDNAVGANARVLVQMTTALA